MTYSVHNKLAITIFSAMDGVLQVVITLVTPLQ